MRSVPMEHVAPMRDALRDADLYSGEGAAMDVLANLANAGWQLHREVREVTPPAPPYQPQHMRTPA